MKLHDRAPPRFSVLYLRIAGVAAFSGGWLGARGQNDLDGRRCRLAIKFHETDGCDLVGSEGRILHVQIHDLLSDVGRKRTLIQLGDGWRWLWREQRSHPCLIKEIGAVVDRAW